MEQARQTFHRLLDNATVADLRKPTNGTKWINEQLLFHLLFGYLIIPALLVLARIFSRLPDPASRAFARLLDAARTPFAALAARAAAQDPADCRGYCSIIAAGAPPAALDLPAIGKA